MNKFFLFSDVNLQQKQICPICFSQLLHQDIFKPKTTLIILLAWPDIKPGTSSFYETKGWHTL